MVASLIAAVALLGAEEPQVVSTAPRGDAAQSALAAPTTSVVPTPMAPGMAPQDLTTDEQIARWLAARAPDQRDAEAPLWDEPLERRMRGEVSAGIGTGGYRDFSAWASMPLGERAELSIGFSQTRNAPWGYRDHGWDRPFGHGWTLPGRGYGHGFDAYGPYDGRVGEPRRDSRVEPPASQPQDLTVRP